MKQTKRPPRPIPSAVSIAAWKSPVFPMEDHEADPRPVPFTYSETEDILLPEDYKPTKCEC